MLICVSELVFDGLFQNIVISIIHKFNKRICTPFRIILHVIKEVSNFFLQILAEILTIQASGRENLFQRLLLGLEIQESLVMQILILFFHNATILAQI